MPPGKSKIARRGTEAIPGDNLHPLRFQLAFEQVKCFSQRALPIDEPASNEVEQALGDGASLGRIDDLLDHTQLDLLLPKADLISITRPNLDAHPP